ncbi:TIR domain-containing protein [Lacticaseibacillus casei]|jgi:hypothetical protein|uniref:TIR domain-containing protein n=1 Tax=Lacticaseibacillus huelsenbergensis TaxID=3035291 RepID=A0ABY8DQX4_9LACO|nr:MULTISPECIES: toll/interleukin-1 receptor domain-containing protein [Lacticaseibacillus]MDG3061864.1 TIR domain-containing protein [Lacticaseibacillus sp. BCRC 81376]QVI38069.1 TIR domain-containing protein [Lacticaseibacillus casei]QXG59854.1 TIR domain-containing protein [Lacticaseibacillus casei]WFB38673.1 TIR domain-containing protein [Lacticaseibacillus huelsenbergensis]WFB43068.1 TIR domain-containing protein [Lacticaseibacillus huelsenbergensis]
MSVSSIQNSIISLQRDLNRLNEKLTHSRQKSAKEAAKVASASEKLGRGNLSSSRISSLNKDIINGQSAQAKEAKNQASISKELQRKNEKLGVLQTQLSKEMQAEQNKSAAKIQRDYQNQLNQLRNQQISILNEQLSSANDAEQVQRKYDVFISYAHSDSGYVTRLREDLEEADIKVWIDSDEIVWGSSLVESINKGFQNSRFTILVLSKDYFTRFWTQQELRAAFVKESKRKDETILPIYLNITADEVSDYNFSLGDIMAMNAAIVPNKDIVSAIKRALKKI